MDDGAAIARIGSWSSWAGDRDDRATTTRGRGVVEWALTVLRDVYTNELLTHLARPHVHPLLGIMDSQRRTHYLGASATLREQVHGDAPARPRGHCSNNADRVPSGSGRLAVRFLETDRHRPVCARGGLARLGVRATWASTDSGAHAD